MSYDLFLWTKKRPEIAEREIEIHDTLLSIDRPCCVGAEDIPTHILLNYDGIAYMTVMNLQPYPSDAAVIKKALKIAADYATKYEGLVDDPQTAGVKSKLQKVKFTERSDDAPEVSITFCFPLDINLHEVIPQFIDLLETYLPVALPRKYGDHEPLPYKYSQMGKAHFLSFLRDSDSMAFWKGTKPISHVFLHDGKKRSLAKAGPGYHMISITLFKEAYKKSNWNTAVHLFMKKAAAVLGVFFAQVTDSDAHTICGPGWRGIPQKTGYAFVIGEPYYSLLDLEHRRGEKIGEKLMFFTAMSRPKIPRKYISRRKPFWPSHTVSYDMNTKARIIPFE